SGGITWCVGSFDLDAKTLRQAREYATDPRSHRQAQVVRKLPAPDELPDERGDERLPVLPMAKRGGEVDLVNGGSGLGGVDRLGMRPVLDRGRAYDVSRTDEVDQATATLGVDAHTEHPGRDEVRHGGILALRVQTFGGPEGALCQQDDTRRLDRAWTVQERAEPPRGAVTSRLLVRTYGYHCGSLPTSDPGSIGSFARMRSLAASTWPHVFQRRTPTT